jgi:antirestriction protein
MSSAPQVLLVITLYSELRNITMTTYTEPKIYVADLAAYTNGKLHGVWINALSDLDEMLDSIKDMLKTSPERYAEEYAIHDYEGFDGCSLSEYQSIESIRNLAIFLNEYPDFGGALLEHFNNDVEQAQMAAEENYQGCFEYTADYAQAITEDTASIPTHLQYYVDYERMARDMEMNGDYFTLTLSHNKVYVFNNA